MSTRQESQVKADCFYAILRFILLIFDLITVSQSPKSLALLNKTENTLKIEWEPPLISNGVIQEYQVSAVPVSSYSVSSVASPMEFVFPSSSSKEDLLGLQPGTDYNVTIRVKTVEGYGIPSSQIYSTEIGSK